MSGADGASGAGKGAYMKRITILVGVLLTLAGCGQGLADYPAIDEPPETPKTIGTDGILESESVGEENNGSSKSEKTLSNNESYVLDGIIVNDLFSMNLGEVIELLGPNHTEPSFFEGGTQIEYPGSCIVAYSGSAAEGKEAQVNPDAEILVITIFQEVDVYKGISVGKTLDEINSNPDLKNKLEIEVPEYYDPRIHAGGMYEHGGKFIVLTTGFDENTLCKYIVLKLEKEFNPVHTEI